MGTFLWDVLGPSLDNSTGLLGVLLDESTVAMLTRIARRVHVGLHVDVEHGDRARDRVHLKKRVEPGRPGCQRAGLGAMHHAVTP